jgi:uncharacterized protein
MIDSRSLGTYRDAILRLAAKHGARNVRIFGSVARDEATFGSDLDFLVDLEPGRTLLDWSAFWQDLEKLLGRSVDVAIDSSLRPEIRQRALSEARPI